VTSAEDDSLPAGQHLRDLLTTQARRFEKKTFLEAGDLGYSYGAIDDATDRAATGLSRLGLRRGERVALLLPNRPEFLFFLLGAPKLGLVSVPLDPAWSEADIVALLRHSGAAAVVTPTRDERLIAGAPEVRHWIAVDDPGFSRPPFNKLAAGSVLGFWPEVDSEDAACIAYVRKSGGEWKGIELSHRNLIGNAGQTLSPFRMDERDRFLCALPLASMAAAVLLVLAPWMVGASCVLKAAFPADLLGAVQESCATVLVAPADCYESISRSPDFLSCDLSSLRLAICNAGTVRERTLLHFEKMHDVLIVQGYGVPEASCLCCANPYTGVRKPGSLGLPLPGQECMIVDAGGAEVPPGESGEIVVRGPNVMKGYYHDPAATAEAIKNGWLHTGDVGYADSDGYYHLGPHARPV
jgi:long-chain acyl-CoA synthetase